jgi:hypothetical protein
VAARPAVQRGRAVNHTSDAGTTLRERHAASDFDTIRWQLPG